jgi:mutator protein MutT
MKKMVRAVAVLINGDEVLLIHRKNKKEYFVFPGGGVEDGESVEQAVIREMQEETTIDVKIDKLLYHHIYDDGSQQFFYLCDYIKGEPKLREDSEEKMTMLKGKDFYEPLWIKINKLSTMLVYPLEVRDLLVRDYKNHFIGPVKKLVIKISDLRQSL